jgi:hypothetical protein
MPTPTIPDGELFMNATVWTGDNTTPRSITNGTTGQSFQPDLVWIKSRSAAYQHNLYDSVRGAGAARSLSSDQTAAEGGNSNVYGFLSAFNSNGFAVTQGTAGGGGAPNGNAYTNQASTTYVAWQWKAGGAAVTNTAGSISSQVSANTTSGFSIVTWTATNTANQSIGHGLGITPSMIIVKDRDQGTGYNWNTWFTGFSADEYINLNTTAAKTSFSTIWYQTPTSSVFYVGSTGTAVNSSTDRFVAYCFAEVAGYSKFGSYTGNGSTDGPFVYLGFRPKFVMVRRTTPGYWSMKDATRDPYNVADKVLFANDSAAESSPDQLFDLLSNGFKLRGSNNDINASGATYIYMAFAENPFKYANAR